MIKVSQVTYNDVTYKSQTKAKMAIFFDLLGFDWKYQPVKIPLGDDITTLLPYIPDFVIHDVHGRLDGEDLYVECKSGLTTKDWQKLVLFGKFKNKVPQRPFLLINDIFWHEIFDKATDNYVKAIKNRRPKSTYGLWFTSLFTISENSSEIAVLCKDKEGRAAIMSEREFSLCADVKATTNAFRKTSIAYFDSKNHRFMGFRENKFDVQFNPDDLPDF